MNNCYYSLCVAPWQPANLIIFLLNDKCAFDDLKLNNFYYVLLGISRDSTHKRRATGGKRKPLRKKRKFELGRPPANTKVNIIRALSVNIRPVNNCLTFFTALNDENACQL